MEVIGTIVVIVVRDPGMTRVTEVIGRDPEGPLSDAVAGMKVVTIEEDPPKTTM